MAHAAGTSPSTRVAVTLVIVGFTEAGTVKVKVHVLEPIFVEPLYVSQVMVQVPDTAFGIWFASVRAGVHETDVDVVFETIVPVVLPKEYVKVCVNDDDALVIVIVEAEFKFVLVADTVDALGIVSRVCVPLAVTLTA